MSKRPDWADEPSTHAELLLGRALTSEEFPYSWEFDVEGIAVCVLQHYPEERGGFAHPDSEEQCTLRFCFVGDTDISSIVSKDHRSRIERMALDDLKAERRKRECQDFDAEASHG